MARKIMKTTYANGWAGEIWCSAVRYTRLRWENLRGIDNDIGRIFLPFDRVCSFARLDTFGIDTVQWLKSCHLELHE